MRYGLTPEGYLEKLAEQGGTCAICPSMKRLCVDHDHVTGKVRGILCHSCNIALPYVENQQFRRNAVAYLEAYCVS